MSDKTEIQKVKATKEYLEQMFKVGVKVSTNMLRLNIESIDRSQMDELFPDILSKCVDYQIKRSGTGLVMILRVF